MACCSCGGGPRWAKAKEPVGGAERQEQGAGHGEGPEAEAPSAEPVRADAGTAGQTPRAERERGCC